MDRDRNLLFGVLALQADALDPARFAEACTAWSTRKDTPLAELLVERGWLSPSDRALIERLLELKLARHGGDVAASLAAAVDEPVRRTLDSVSDPEIRATLTIAPTTDAEGHILVSTVQNTPESRARYTLTRLHARGGLGRVWLARDGDLGREVALKELLPERAENPSLWTRFFDEARITGQLEHPGIVPVYELARGAGDQKPFYTMRFIRGRTLSEAIAAYHRARREGQAGPLDLRGLVDAFVGITNAVAYAHSRGVIHRDLKPQNVVLGDFGEVILLDWGLAKVVDGPEHAPAPRAEGAGRGATVEGQVLGTPAYMAPEQAEGRLDRIDRRSDVYGLGAILYEILAGRPPFTGDDTAEILRRVVQEPPEPPHRLVAETPRALEAVCAWAMAKPPGERYDSAADVGREVRRWLADEPVSAYREPLPTRLARWGRRHRPLVASAAALLVTAVVGLAIGNVLLDRANAATERQRQVADTNFQHALEAVDQFYTRISEDRLLNEPGMERLRKDLLETARDFYRRFVDESQGDRRARAELGRAYLKLARITADIGAHGDALEFNRRALAVTDALAAERPADNSYRRDLVVDLLNLGILYESAGRLADAEAALRRAHAIADALVAKHPADASDRAQRAKVIFGLGKLSAARGRADLARDYQARAVADFEGLAAAEPANESFQLHHAKALLQLARIDEDLGRVSGAEATLKAALGVARRVDQARPDVTEYRHMQAIINSDLMVLYSTTGRHDEAEAAAKAALKIQEALAREHPDVHAQQDQLAGILINLGNVYYFSGRLRPAGEAFERALGIQETLAAEHPGILEYQKALAGILTNLATIESESSAPVRAEQRNRRAIGIFERLVAEHPGQADLEIELASGIGNLAIALVSQGKPQDASALYDRAIEQFRTLLRRDERYEPVRRQLSSGLEARALCYSKLGRHDDALADLDEAITLDNGTNRERLETVRAAELARRDGQELPRKLFAN
jgi:serine/threonine-protein kinase